MPNKDKNKEREYQRLKKRKVTEAFQTLKESVPCKDCDKYFPHYIMEFDHVPERGKKLGCPSRMVGAGITSMTVQMELAKCDIVCANCHNTRTWFRRQEALVSDGRSNLS